MIYIKWRTVNDEKNNDDLLLKCSISWKHRKQGFRKLPTYPMLAREKSSPSRFTYEVTTLKHLEFVHYELKWGNNLSIRWNVFNCIRLIG